MGTMIVEESTGMSARMVMVTKGAEPGVWRPVWCFPLRLNGLRLTLGKGLIQIGAYIITPLSDAIPHAEVDMG